MTNTRSLASGPALAGTSLILAAIAFITVFSILAGSFGYPDILDRPAGEVLPRLLALGTAGRGVWALYACIPLLLTPAAVGAASLHTEARHSTVVRIAEWCAVLAGVSMLLGLVRWPSLHWELARAWAAASSEQRVSLAAVFDGTNMMFGRYIGEFLGELLLNVALVVFSAVAWSDRRLPRWASGFGVLAGMLGLIALWRNIAPLVAPSRGHQQRRVAAVADRVGRNAHSVTRRERSAAGSVEFRESDAARSFTRRHRRRTGTALTPAEWS